MRKLLRSIAVILLLVTLLILVAGGMIFYSITLPEGTGVIAILGAALQNSMESLLFNPIITIGDVFQSEAVLWESLPLFEQIVMRLFCVAVVVAPFLDVLIVFSLVDAVLRVYASVSFASRHVLVIGRGEAVNNILSQERTGKKVFFWTEESLSKDEEQFLALHHVIVIYNKPRVCKDENDYNAKVSKFNRFMVLHRITDVVLADKSDSENIRYYMAISDCCYCNKTTVHFRVKIEERENALVLERYFDNLVNSEAGEKISPHRDLHMFNFPQIRAEELFMNKSFYDGADNKEVHLAIIGGGCVGERVLLHAFNQGVMTPDNRIIIDVFDKNPDNVTERLRERFSEKSVKWADDFSSFCVRDDVADGALSVCFHPADVYSSDFTAAVDAVQKRHGMFTHLAVCLPDEDMNLHCAICLQGHLEKIPVALRMDYSRQLETLFKNVYFLAFLGRNESGFGLDRIINSDEEEKIRRFNCTYNAISNKVQDNPAGDTQKADRKNIVEKLWNSSLYYQREATRALFNHIEVKKDVAKANRAVLEKEINGFKEFNELLSGSDAGEQPGTDALSLSRKLVETDAGKAYVRPELEKYARTEHRRWCYFYVSEGWECGDRKVPEMKIHNCMVPWQKLKEIKSENLVYDLISLPIVMEKLKNDEKIDK